MPHLSLCAFEFVQATLKEVSEAGHVARIALAMARLNAARSAAVLERLQASWLLMYVVHLYRIFECKTAQPFLYITG